jgi:hypothetical protein
MRQEVYMNKVIEIVKTKGTGKPAMWESGGGFTNTGSVRIIAGPAGEKKRALFGGRGPACACHALVPISVDDVVIELYRHWDEFKIQIWRVKSLQDRGEHFLASVELIYEFDKGEWVPQEPQESFKSAIKAAIDKSRDYHCRVAYYCEPPSKNPV